MTPLIRRLYCGAVLFFPGSCFLYAGDYFTVQQIEQAKASAREKHLPIAWLSSPLVFLKPVYANDNQGSTAELTNLALRTLQGQAVVIFQNIDYDLPNMPANMIDRIEVKDEGDNLPGGQHYTAPKIIYTDPNLATIFGCTLAPDLRTEREAAINVALLHIHNDPKAQALIKGTIVPTTTPVIDQSTNTAAMPVSFSAWMALTDFAFYLPYATGALLLLVLMGVYFVWRGRRRTDS